MPCSNQDSCIVLAEVVWDPHTTGDPSITAPLLEWKLVSVSGEMLCMGWPQPCPRVSNVLRRIDCIDYRVSTDISLGTPAFKYLLFQMDSCPNSPQLTSGLFQHKHLLVFRLLQVLPQVSIQKILALLWSQRYFNYDLSFNCLTSLGLFINLQEWTCKTLFDFSL